MIIITNAQRDSIRKMLGGTYFIETPTHTEEMRWVFNWVLHEKWRNELTEVQAKMIKRITEDVIAFEQNKLKIKVESALEAIFNF